MAHCPDGGVMIEVGVDDDRSGVLDANEVDQTARVCQAPVVRKRVVFVTSQTWNGDLGGIAGADAKCQAAASAVTGLASKSFKAWLSTSATDSASRYTTDGSFVRMDGMKVADTWADLLAVNAGSYAFISAISLTELGQATNAGHVWSGSDADGTIVAAWPWTCNDWTSSSSGVQGISGWPTRTDKLWSWAQGQSCDKLQPLYCVEQ